MLQTTYTRKVFCFGTAAVDGSVETCCLWEWGGCPLQKKSESQRCFYKVFLWESDFLFCWKVENINKRPLWSENMGVFKLHLLKEYFRPWKPAAGFCCLKEQGASFFTASNILNHLCHKALRGCCAWVQWKALFWFLSAFLFIWNGSIYIS